MLFLNVLLLIFHILRMCDLLILVLFYKKQILFDYSLIFATSFNLKQVFLGKLHFLGHFTRIRCYSKGLLFTFLILFDLRLIGSFYFFINIAFFDVFLFCAAFLRNFKTVQLFFASHAVTNKGAHLELHSGFLLQYFGYIHIVCHLVVDSGFVCLYLRNWLSLLNIVSLFDEPLNDLSFCHCGRESRQLQLDSWEKPFNLNSF